MMGQMYCGVFVHWSVSLAVYHFGKSTSALIVAKRIHDSRLPVKYSKTCYITQSEPTASVMLFGLTVGFTNKGDYKLSIAHCTKYEHQAVA